MAATAREVLAADLDRIRIVTRKGGGPRCESTTVYGRTTKTVDDRLWITLSTTEGDPTVVVDDLDQEIVQSGDPAGDYDHTIFVDTTEG